MHDHRRPQLNIRMSPDELMRLRELAARQGLTVSAYVRTMTGVAQMRPVTTTYEAHTR